VGTEISSEALMMLPDLKNLIELSVDIPLTDSVFSHWMKVLSSFSYPLPSLFSPLSTLFHPLSFSLSSTHLSSLLSYPLPAGRTTMGHHWYLSSLWPEHYCLYLGLFGVYSAVHPKLKAKFLLSSFIFQTLSIGVAVALQLTLQLTFVDTQGLYRVWVFLSSLLSRASFLLTLLDLFCPKKNGWK
jgi:hypothetical protein